jgi:predicted GH43/DUF377 family glycosyl hydrolase
LQTTPPPVWLRRREIVLWPWQVTPSGAHGLGVVAVANPALEAVLLQESPDRPIVAADPHQAYTAEHVVGFQLILRVIEAPPPGSAPEGRAASPRMDLATQAIVIENFGADTHDTSDPRLVVPRKGQGIRLPSISHLRRVVLRRDGTLERVENVVLPDTTRFETLGKEDPSVTWLAGTPYLSFVGVSEYGITPVLAKANLQQGPFAYERVTEAMGHHDNRDVKILPIHAQGKMWRHDRPNTLPWASKRIYFAWSADDGVSWSASLPLYEGEASWEIGHIGSGVVPFVHERPDGTRLMVSFYHGVHKQAGAVAGVYQTGLACFDVDDPGRMVGRLIDPVLPTWAPEAFQAALQAVRPLGEADFKAKHGLFIVEPVVFTTGHARVGDEQILFSGVNDFCIERADLAPLESLLDSPAFRPSEALH